MAHTWTKGRTYRRRDGMRVEFLGLEDGHPVFFHADLLSNAGAHLMNTLGDRDCGEASRGARCVHLPDGSFYIRTRLDGKLDLGSFLPPSAVTTEFTKKMCPQNDMLCEQLAIVEDDNG